MNILSPGAQIGKYRVVGLLATGGMGLLYQAVHPRLGTQVAIKTIKPELANDKNIVDRFVKEAMAASRVRDPRLPAVYDQDFLESGAPYLVMELLHGQDLSARLSQGPMVPAAATRVIVEVLEVLHKVHQLDIVHRDIKPQNIFLALDDMHGEVPKLLDFGVAHVAYEASMTRPGEMMGTPFYMSPEQARSEAVTARTDIFSAGVVLYECLAGLGQRPWGDGNPLAYVTQLSNGTPGRPLGNVAPKGCPAALADVVMKAIELNPADRFETAEVFAQSLEPFAQARGTNVSRPARRAAEAQVTAPSVPTTTSVAQRTPSISARSGPNPAALIRKRLQGLRNQGATPARLSPGERRQVFVLALRFRLHESQALEIDPAEREMLRADVAQLFEEVLRNHEVVLRPLVGAVLVATFGHDRVREDDARRALAAAHELIRQRAWVDAELADLGCSVNVRVGLHRGFVVQTGGDHPATLVGETSEVAVQLAEHAPWNTVVSSGAFREVVEHDAQWRRLGPVQIPGAPPVDTFEAREVLSASLSIEDAPMVGRRDALDRLRAAVAQSGAPRAIVVDAPAGMGKSRLLRALTTAPDPDVPLAFVWAVPVALRPFGLLANLVQDILFGSMSDRPTTWLLESRLESLAKALDDTDAHRLRGYSEECGLLLGRRVLVDAPQAEARSVRSELGTFVRLLLTAHACTIQQQQGRRLVLLVDQIHDADLASLDLLSTIIDQLGEGVPVHFVVARRPEDRFEVPPLVQREEVALGPLDDEEVDQLIDQAAEGEVSRAARALIVERAQGNPLFVGELALTLASHNLLNAREQQLAGFPLPGSIYGVLLARVDRLPHALREAVRSLSVVGDPIDVRVWSGVYHVVHGGARRDPAPIRLLQDLEEHGVLRRRTADGLERYMFAQPLLRDAVYKTVLPDNRRLLHETCAQSIESTPAPDTLGRDLQLLAHYRHTDHGKKTLYYARKAGRRGLQLGAIEVSVEALDLALTLQSRVAGQSPLDRAETQVDAAWSRFYVGRLEGAINAALDAVALLEIAPENGDLEAVGARQLILAKAHMAAANAANYRADWDLAETQLESAEYMFTQCGETAQAARAQCQLGFVLRSMGKPEEGVEMARDGYSVLRSGGDLGAFVRAGHDFGNILRDLGQHAEAIRVFDEAIAAGEDLAAQGQHFAAKWALAAKSGRAMALAAVGRLQEAAIAQREVYDSVLRNGHLVAQAVSASHLAQNYFDLEEMAAAREFAERALVVAGRVQMPKRAVRARLLLARIDRAAADQESACEQLEAAEFLARSAESVQSHLGDTLWFEVLEPLVRQLCALGRTGRAGALLDEADIRAERRADAALRARVADMRETLLGSITLDE